MIFRAAITAILLMTVTLGCWQLWWSTQEAPGVYRKLGSISPKDRDKTRVPRDVLDGFVESRERNARVLLAAWAESKDQRWLREAAERFPHDPAVLFSVVAYKLYPEQQEEWLQKLQDAAPENQMAYYLAATHFYSAGDKSRAIAEMKRAESATKYDDYIFYSLDETVALLRYGGMGPIAAQVWANFCVAFPHAEPLQELRKQILEDEKAALSSGDFQGAADLALRLVYMGRTVRAANGAPAILHELMGISYEAPALSCSSITPRRQSCCHLTPRSDLRSWRPI